MKSIKQKLIVSMLLISIIPILIIGSVAFGISSQAILKETNQGLNNTTQQIYDMVAQVQTKVESDVESTLNLVQYQFEGLGNMRLDSDQPITVGEYTMPALVTEHSSINNEFDFVDLVKNLSGADCTIFQLHNNELVRISTTVTAADGNRAIGTSIKSDSPVYQAIIKDERYIGRANVVGVMNIAGYNPIKINGEVVGAIFIGKPENDGALDEKILSYKLGETGYACVVDSTGKTVVHPKGIIDVSQLDFIKSILQQKNGTMEYTYEGEKKIAYFKYFEKWDWFIVTTVPLTEVFKSSNSLMVLILVIGLACTSLVIGMGYLIAIGFSKPIHSLVDAFESMKAGDLTHVLNIKSKDELGKLGESYNHMISTLKQLIRQVKDSTESVYTASSQLSAATEESNKAMEDIAVNITEIANNAQDNASSIQETVAGIEEVTSSAQLIAKSSTEASSLSTEVETSAENGAQSVKNIVEVVNDISKSSQNVIQLIEELNMSAARISDISLIIEGISEQTNLLSLNAAIEAARAGEAGRGFAVVANEVRKLAEESKTSTSQIASLIKEVQEKTKTVIEAVRKSDNKVKQGVSNADGTYTAIVNILDNIRIVVRRIGEISKNTELQADTADQISKAVETVAAMTGATASSTQTISAGIEEQVSTFEEIGATAQEMKNMAASLQQLIGKFKVD